MFKLKKIVPYFLLLFPLVAFANGETPVSQGLSYIINAMYGTTGVAVATLSVMVTGLLCLGHVFKWTTFGYVVLGIGLVFGAGPIVNGIISYIHF